MKALEDSVRSIEMAGLVWGASKLVPIGYGIRKLQITLVVGSSVTRVRHASVVFDLMNIMKRTNSCRLMNFKRNLPTLKIMFRALT
jgi:translation elongation factor EF-1beta